MYMWEEEVPRNDTTDQDIHLFDTLLADGVVQSTVDNDIM